MLRNVERPEEATFFFFFFLGTSGFLVQIILYFLPLMKMKYFLIFRFTYIFNDVTHRYVFDGLFITNSSSVESFPQLVSKWVAIFSCGTSSLQTVQLTSTERHLI